MKFSKSTRSSASIKLLGVIEKRSTSSILSNILLEASGTKLTITATDLDLIFIHQIENVEIIEEGKPLLIINHV